MAVMPNTIPVPIPSWEVFYQGHNITANIAPSAIEIEYVDHLGGVAGEFTIKIADAQKNWQGPWYPVQGDVISAAIGWQGSPLLDCGTFQVDKADLVGPPDVFTISTLPTYITPNLRTPVSFGYENVSLLSIANTIAAKHGFTVVGAPTTINVIFLRVTQRHESDLAFLARLAAMHNYDFTIRGTKLYFYARPTAEAAPPAYLITRNNVDRFTFQSRSQETYNTADVSYFSPTSKSLISSGAESSIRVNPKVGDTLKVVTRVESGAAATLKADGVLHQANLLVVSGNFEMVGTTVLLAGLNINIKGFGSYDGIYRILTATHTLDHESGYKTKIEFYRVTGPLT